MTETGDWEEAGDVECPRCGEKWEETNWVEMTEIGTETECPKCGVLLELWDTEAVLSWVWAVKND